MKILLSKKGSVLVFIVFFVAVLLVFALFLPDINSTDVRIAANQRGSTEAHYLAVAGVEAAIKLLAEDPFYSGNGVIPFAEAEITLKIDTFKNPDLSLNITITSTGEVGFMRETIIMEIQTYPGLVEGIDGTALDWYDPAKVIRKRGN